MKNNFMDRPIWVYEFHTFLYGEESDFEITLESPKVVGWRLWNGDPVYVDVEGRHKGVAVNQIGSVLDTSNKRVKKIWLEDRNDRLAKAIFGRYCESHAEICDLKSIHLKSLCGISKKAEVRFE